jgi:hypothetical protein
MFNYIKTYQRAGDTIEFIFSTAQNAGFDFDITDVSELEHGFEDQDELTIYPSNIDITIDDISGGNYNRFKTLLDEYNKTYPFNFQDVLTITIKKNGNEKYVGILFNVEYEFEPSGGNVSEHIRLTWVSGCQKLKELEFGNYYVLEKLWQAGLIQRTEVRRFGVGELVGYMYGYNVAFVGLPGNGNILFFGEPVASVRNIFRFIETLFQILNPNCFLEINHNWLFNDLYSFQQLFLYGIEGYLTGRYFVKIENEFVIFAHDPGRWQRQQHSMVNGVEWSVWWDSDGNEGVPDRKLNEALKFISRNFGAMAGMTSFNRAFFRKRFYTNPTEAIDITSDALNVRKETFLPKKSQVKINDLFQRYTASRGELSYDDNLLEYNILLSAYDNGSGGGANLFSPLFEYILNVTDTGISYRYKLSEVLAELEWRTRMITRSKFNFDINSTNLSFTSFYSIIHRNEIKYIRPVKMREYLLDNRTEIEGIETN